MRLGDLDALKKRVRQSTVSRPIKAAMEVLINTAPTIDPVKAAGGCYCRECRWGQEDDIGVMHCHKYHIRKKPGGYCDGGEPREARDDE